MPCEGTGSDSDQHFAMLVLIRANFKLGQAPVVQKCDSAIHCINHYQLNKIVLGKPIALSREIYPVDSVIQSLNNCTLVYV